MKRIIIFLLLFFIILYTFAQKKVFYKEIKWTQPKSVSHYFKLNQKDINKTTFLYFENANYYDNNTMLPYFYSLIKVNSANSQAKISNVKYKPLSIDEISALKNKNSIPAELSYQSYIHYKRNQPYLQINFLPLRNLNGQMVKIVSFTIEIIPKEAKNEVESLKEEKLATESVLKTGNWVKVRFKSDGIYKLQYSELINLGFSNPENIKVFGNSSGMLPVLNTEPCQDDLTQNAIYFEKGNDGVFNEGDYVLFFAKGPDQWTYSVDDNFFSCKKHIYSDYNYVFLTTGAGSVFNVTTNTSPTGTATETITGYTDYIHYENELENLLESGQLWLGENFDITTNYNVDFEFPDLIKSSPVHLRASLAARSSQNTSFNLKNGATTITDLGLTSVDMSSYTSEYADIGVCEGSFFSSTDNFTINITYNKSSSSSVGWLDYITLNAERLLRMDNGQLLFRYYNDDVISKIIEFRIQNTSSTTKVWDVTETNEPFNISYSNLAGNVISFKVEVDPGLNEFIAFNNDAFLTVESVGNIENQNLHAIGHRDMIIISHPDFLGQANEIAALHHDNDDLQVAVVTPEQIFNEFSSGTPDATAIRNFVRMVYNRPSATDTLKYLLLLGDGSYDHKSITAENINYVLTYQSKNSLSPTRSFVTDDFFGLLDSTDNIEAGNSGLVDIGIGRFPVSSVTEAQQMLDKIRIYTNPLNKGDWINTICFVGDDEDNNLHMRDADKLATFVDTTYPYFFVNKVYLDAYPQESSTISESYPEVNRLINDQVNNGVLIFNYTGHGGESGLAHERILSIDDINSWVNNDKLAIFMTATCEFSRFDNHKNTSAGELVILNPNGGGIALFTTTRLVYPNYTLNRNFYNYVFEKDYKGRTRALGDIIRLAKNASGTENNKRNFTLLGDPALKVPVAQYSVITDSINSHSVSEYVDTLKALTKVTIHGHIENESNLLANNYNGIVYPLVLDKKRKITTLGNDGGPTMDFQVQNNTLYKGKASVTNGDFQFSFVVPKDISYNYGNGKVTYYSVGSDKDAKGYFTDFIIGGSGNNAESDNLGPDIQLYMNDENFVSGGVTDENPKLYALLSDSSGINTVGNGIGHDITAILDNNSGNQIILNDYYESNIDNYQKGSIEYLFSELENGSHNLKLKVWDVYNNSSEKNLDFVVAESGDLVIKNIFNYPNPFTGQTNFYFDHNRPNEDLEVLIQVFTISGKLVKTINHIINSNAFRSEPIHWDGLDDFGDKLGRGVYIYQLNIRTVDGETASKIEKLVILK